MSTLKDHESLRRMDERRLLHPFSALHTQPGRDVLVVREAEGLVLTDDRGHPFIDAGSGLWCSNVGYGRAEIVRTAAAQMQAVSFSHNFNVHSSEPLIQLSERLVALAPPGFERVVYANSGSEANDAQVKLAWRYHFVRGKPSKKKIISRMGGYHGATVMAGSLTGLEVTHRGFHMPLDFVLHTEAAQYHRRPAAFDGDELAFSRYLADQLDRMIQAEGAETIAAFFAEPIMGSAGVILPPAGYFAEIQKILVKHDVLLVADEVITAFGRTGAWFASPGLDMRPDLITVAKGLTSGYFPMSACLVSRNVGEVLYSEKEADGMFGHGFTTAGHPVAAAVALANLDIIEREGLLANSAETGAYLLEQLREKLRGAAHLGEIRGKGLFAGIEFDEEPGARRPFSAPARISALLQQCLAEERVLLRSGHGRVVGAVAPPLIVTPADVDEIVNRVARAVGRFEERLPTCMGA